MITKFALGWKHCQPTLNDFVEKGTVTEKPEDYIYSITFAVVVCIIGYALVLIQNI